MPTVTYPYGTSETFVVDKVLGASYQTVKFVASNMHIIKHVSDNLQNLVDIEDFKDGVETVAQNMDSILKVLAHIEKLVEIYGAIPVITALHEKLPEFVELFASLPKFLHLYDNRDIWYHLYGERLKFYELHNKLPKLMEIYDHLAELLSVESNKTQLLALHTNLSTLISLHGNLPQLLQIQSNITALLNLNSNLAVITNVNSNMATLTAVAANIAAIQNVATSLALLQDVIDIKPEILALSSNLAPLQAIFTHLAALLNINANMAALLGLWDNVSDPNWVPVLPSDSILVSGTKQLSLNVDPSSNNILSVSPSGVLVDGSTIATNITGMNPIEVSSGNAISLKVNPSTNNLLTVTPSGVFVEQGFVSDEYAKKSGDTFTGTVIHKDSVIMMRDLGSAQRFQWSVSNPPDPIWGSNVERLTLSRLKSLNGTGTDQTIAYINEKGDMSVNTLTATGINTPSSRFIKHDIKSLSYGLEAVLNMEPCQFVYNDDALNRVKLGFIAEDLESVVPEAVCMAPHGSGEAVKGVDLTLLVPVLCRAIQELTERVRVLESKEQ